MPAANSVASFATAMLSTRGLPSRLFFGALLLEDREHSEKGEQQAQRDVEVRARVTTAVERTGGEDNDDDDDVEEQRASGEHECPRDGALRPAQDDCADHSRDWRGNGSREAVQDELSEESAIHPDSYVLPGHGVTSQNSGTDDGSCAQTQP